MELNQSCVCSSRLGRGAGCRACRGRSRASCRRAAGRSRRCRARRARDGGSGCGRTSARRPWWPTAARSAGRAAPRARAGRRQQPAEHVRGEAAAERAGEQGVDESGGRGAAGSARPAWRGCRAPRACAGSIASTVERTSMAARASTSSAVATARSLSSSRSTDSRTAPRSRPSASSGRPPARRSWRAGAGLRRRRHAGLRIRRRGAIAAGRRRGAGRAARRGARAGVDGLHDARAAARSGARQEQHVGRPSASIPARSSAASTPSVAASASPSARITSVASLGVECRVPGGEQRGVGGELVGEGEHGEPAARAGRERAAGRGAAPRATSRARPQPGSASQASRAPCTNGVGGTAAQPCQRRRPFEHVSARYSAAQRRGWSAEAAGRVEGVRDRAALREAVAARRAA